MQDSLLGPPTPAVTYRDSSSSQGTEGWISLHPMPALLSCLLLICLHSGLGRGSGGTADRGSGRKQPMTSRLGTLGASISFQTGLGSFLALWGLICDFVWNPRFPEVREIPGETAGPSEATERPISHCKPGSHKLGRCL